MALLVGNTKLQSDWLSGHALQAYARGGGFAGPLGAWVAAWSTAAWSRSVSAWSVPALELSIAVLLVVNRRRLAVFLALAFHVCVELVVNPDLLGWQMAVLSRPTRAGRDQTTLRTSTDERRTESRVVQ